MLRITLPRALVFCAILLNFLATEPARSAPPLPVTTRGTITVYAQGAGEPDDVAVAPDGTVYYSDLHLNRVIAVNPRGQWTPVSPRIRAPEGLVALADGRVLVAEQETNRLYMLDPLTQVLTPFFSVGNVTANPGIDGLSPYGTTGDFLIPDAPTGRLLRLNAAGTTLTQIADRFRRPTAAVIDADGTLYVCDEYGYQIDKITPDGMITVLARITLPDDLALDGRGGLWVNSLRGTIYRIDLATHATEAVVTLLGEPHGLALLPDGSLIIADATGNRLYRLTLP